MQDRLKSGLLKIMPDAHFMGEEGTTQEFSPKGKFFIVDPETGGIVTDIDGNALAYDRKSSILARNKAAMPIE